MSEQLLVGAAEAAKMLAISPRKLWEITNAGQVPVVRVGRRVLYAPEDLIDFVGRAKGDGHGQRL